MSNRIFASLVFGVTGFLAAGLIMVHGRGLDWLWSGLVIGAGVGSYILAYFFWYLFVLKKQSYSIWRALLVGAWVGMLSHPIAWYGFFLVGYFSGVKGSLGDPAMNPLQAIWAAFVYSLPSLFIAGWFTIGIGSAVGIFLVLRLRRSQS